LKVGLSILLILAVVLLVIGIETPEQSKVANPQSNEMTVCYLMERLKQYNGQIVTIKGTLLPIAKGQPYFTTLAPTPPESCPAPGASDRRAEIDLSYPDPYFLKNPPNGFQYDKNSITQAEDKITQVFRRNPNVSGFLVVVQGLLHVAEKGPAVPPDYDRHGWYPASLKVQSYKSIVEP